MFSEEKRSKMSKTVWQSACHDLVEIEIGQLIHERVYVMAENEEYLVLRAMADRIPHTLYEIGRLRELTSVEKGEGGAGRTVDLDHFDLYYIHLIVWNKKKREIVGSCRVGQADIILKRYGMSGLYTGAMFRYSLMFQQEIGPALEIGKVFIRPEYWRRSTPISLLWRGVGHFLSYNPRYKVLVGLCSISNRYSSLSRQIMMSFLKKNSYAPKAARFVEPVLPEPCTTSGEGNETVKTRLKDIKALTKLISEIEADGKRIPYDLKHFIKLGGKLIGFGGDPSLKNAFCGLVLVDLTKCSRGVLNHCMGKSGVEGFFDYHGGREDRAA